MSIRRQRFSPEIETSSLRAMPKRFGTFSELFGLGLGLGFGIGIGPVGPRVSVSRLGCRVGRLVLPTLWGCTESQATTAFDPSSFALLLA